MHPEQIKAELRMAGVSPAMLADELDVTSVTVSTVIHGKCSSERVKARIAEIIQRPVDEIWAPRPSLVRRRKPSATPKH